MQTSEPRTRTVLGAVQTHNNKDSSCPKEFIRANHNSSQLYDEEMGEKPEKTQEVRKYNLSLI